MTKKNKKCILPFVYKGKIRNECVELKKGKICPIKLNEKNQLSILGKKGVDYEYCKDTDSIDNDKWVESPGTYLHPQSKGKSILKSKHVFTSVKEALEECYKLPECKGVTDDLKTSKITMRVSDNLKQNKDRNSWIKK